MVAKTFGEALKAFRNKHNLSQSDIGEKVGVHSSSVGHWERGLGMNQTTWKKFAPAFPDLATILPPFTTRTKTGPKPKRGPVSKKAKKKEPTLRVTLRPKPNGTPPKNLSDASTKLATAFGEFGRIKGSISDLRSQLDGIIHQASTLRDSIDTAAHDAASATTQLIAALEGDVN